MFSDKNESGTLKFSENGRAWVELDDQLLTLIRKSQERTRLVEDEDREITEALCAPDEKVEEYKTKMKWKREIELERARKRPKIGRPVHNELVGKMIEHLIKEGHDDKWHNAFVSSKTNQGLNLVYLTDTNNVYFFSQEEIRADMETGDIYVHEIKAIDLLGFKIRYKFYHIDLPF